MFKKISDLLCGITDINILENEPLSRHTTFKIGGPASVFIDIFTAQSAIDVIRILRDANLHYFILGNGSNLLAADEGYSGIILRLSCNKISVEGNTIFAEAGALLSEVASIAQKHSLCGMEFAHGIPGTLGGAVVMNAGAYGGEIRDILKSSTYIAKGSMLTIDNDSHLFGYRTSIYKKDSSLTVLSAEFSLQKGCADKIAEKMRELAKKRRDKQPLEYPSAGSVFKRPEGYFAGALIEQCGLKGFSIGGAEVSKKHAGFIINRGGATADDVKKLILHIQETVLKETGVSLEREICYI